ncbi:MAG: helix-turn-helix domain-containing protein [Blastocatellia bacterium]
MSKVSALKNGEYFGSVPLRRSSGSAVISEIFHVNRNELPAHSHGGSFFSLLLGGSYREQLGSRQNYFEPMTIWWRRAGVAHQDAIGINGGRFFNIDVSDDLIAEVERLRALPSTFSTRTGAAVPVAYRLLFEFRNWEEDSAETVNELVYQIIAGAAKVELTEDHHEPQWLTRVHDKLSDSPFENHSLEDLATEAGVHPIHLATSFRKFRGQTIGDFVRGFRVSSAAQLLVDKKQTLADIAAETGFYDQSHLNRVFKRWIGTTPEVFRRSV